MNIFEKSALVKEKNNFIKYFAIDFHSKLKYDINMMIVNYYHLKITMSANLFLQGYISKCDETLFFFNCLLKISTQTQGKKALYIILKSIYISKELVQFAIHFFEIIYHKT